MANESLAPFFTTYYKSKLEEELEQRLEEE